MVLDIRKGVDPGAIVAESRAIWSEYWGHRGALESCFVLISAVRIVHPCRLQAVKAKGLQAMQAKRLRALQKGR